ncbi:MAG: hypothetical protein DWQ34_09780 [Planctomycetota bacterium]|nr:MAG: hypothetical protein DWQ34_09780 [Planctomycetota bacterium]
MAFIVESSFRFLLEVKRGSIAHNNWFCFASLIVKAKQLLFLHYGTRPELSTGVSSLDDGSGC